jgi:hypothetical protein
MGEKHKNRNVTRAAKALMQAEGVNYTTALRRVQATMATPAKASAEPVDHDGTVAEDELLIGHPTVTPGPLGRPLFLAPPGGPS